MVQTNLYVALNNALTGLSVNQTALATLSQNISNANTPGYSRQAVQLADNVVNGGGYGVKVEDVTRQVDLFLQRSSQQQNAVFSKSSVLNNYAQQIQALLGQPNGSSSTTSDSSIASAVTGFFNAVQQLAQSPTDGSMQLNMVSSAQNLASGVSGLAAGLQNLRYQADQQISQDVTTVNSTLVNLKQVNDAIGFASSTGNVSPDLLDQRDSMIKTLTQYLDINYYFDSSQQVHISASGGQPLLDGSISQLGYTPQSSVDNFTSNLPLQPITVQAMDANGQPIGKPTQLSTGGASSTITTSMTNGEIRGLMDMRDTQIPQLLDQLDMLASTVRDQVNAIQNSGSPYPGAASYTGQRSVSASDFSNWSGNVQIALLGPNGQPAISPYNGDTNGVPPLNLDLSSLDTGAGAGNPSVQGIINAINTYFTPKNRVSLGDINNIQLASDSPKLPSSPPQFSFDLNLENTTGKPANVFVTNVQVKDAAGTDITSYSSTAPVVNLASTGTYTTTAGSNLVTLTATGPISGVQDGDYVYLSQPPGPVNGIPANELGGGFFKVMNVSGNTFQIQTPTTPAASSGTDNESGITATPKYTTVGAGVNTRTNNNGIFTANLGANPNSSFYTITLDVTTQNADGTLSSGQVQYQVTNPDPHTLNTLYGATAANGAAVLKSPQNTNPLLTASLVDAHGNELPKVNGQYLTNQSGYLKLTAAGNNAIAINSQDSKQLGQPNTVPAQPGTNRNFSYYFELNNFFNDNKPTATGDTVAGSAANLSVQTRLINNPNLISSGQLQQTPPLADGTPVFTYERSAGDNSILQQFAALGNANILFTAAGGLGNVSTSLNGYAGQILSFSASNAATAQSNFSNAKLVANNLNQQITSQSGVNLDQELANTVIYQNAYTASARIVTVTNSLFNTLLQSFQ